ncbi:hypothetical protein [Nocardioides aquiterrae]|uniref:PH domain-containing protein n=1 Tax=Nocardioides aquiterrae TaxID=203799 RepID=A0ABN1URC8_9ACTN
MTNRRTGRNALYGLGYLLLALLGVALVVTAGDRTLGLLSGLLLLVLAASGFVLVGFDWWYAGHRPGLTTATAPSGRPATAFPRSRVPFVMSVVVPVLLAVWALAGSLLVEHVAARVGLLLLAVVFASPLVAVVRGRVAPGGLYLTPEGVEQRKEAVSWSLPWDRVAGVVPGEPLALVLNGPPPDQVVRTRWLWRREPTGPAGVVAVDSRYLAERPEVVAELVARCIVHPPLRERLGTPEVVAEIRREG